MDLIAEEKTAQEIFPMNLLNPSLWVAFSFESWFAYLLLGAIAFIALRLVL